MTAPLKHADAIERGLMDIGRAAKESGVAVKMIRHYEAIGLLPKAPRTLGKYRVYGAKDINVLRFIKRARTLGLPMADIRELLSLWRGKPRSSASVKRIAEKHAARLRHKLAESKAMLDTLEGLGRVHGKESSRNATQ